MSKPTIGVKSAGRPFVHAFLWFAAVASMPTLAAEEAASPGANPHRLRVQQWLSAVPQAEGSAATESTTVVDGKPAKAGKWPFMVSLVDKSNSDNYAAHFCGGSLIDSKNVLTAGHCVKGSQAGSMQVLVGTQSLVEGGRRIDVTRITVNPGFTANPFLQGDVAVLRLAEEVTDIPPVVIAASTAQDDAVAPDNARTTVMGWGALAWDKDGPEVLYQAPLVRNTIEECNGLSLYNGKLTANNVCAGDLQNPGKSACYGDSGGPLVGKDSDGKTVQIGVVSGGPSKCGQVPGYFARVGAYAKWIKQQVVKP